MALDRESRYAALFSRLKSEVSSVRYFSRRDMGYEQVKAQPALLLVAGNHVPSPGPGKPSEWTLEADIYVYAKTNDLEQSPETQLNEIVQQIEKALEWDAKRDPGNPLPYTTLGGACRRCQIAGPIEVEQGAEGGQGGVHVPIEIICG